MPANPHPLLYELNTRCWLRGLSGNPAHPITLENVPDTEFLRWKRLGFTHIWLMGVWKVGPRSRVHSLSHIRQHAAEVGCHESDIHGSTYSIAGYQVQESLGGELGLRHFRERLQGYGLKLILDFIPNHVGLDHPWLREAPQLLVHALRKTPGTFREHTAAGTLYIAHGKDPYFPPWSDTAQVDYRNPDSRRRMQEELLSVARRCDGVRCDMAMLVLNDIFQRNWTAFPSNYPAAEKEFWAEAIPAVRSVQPGFLLLAEAYWDLEPRLQQLGFDFVYLKAFYDHLVARRYGELRTFLQKPISVLGRGAFFLENHDEPRIARLLSWPEHQAALLLLLGMPGLRLLHEGQLEGCRNSISVHFSRRPVEHPPGEVVGFYEALLAFLLTTSVGKGSWTLLQDQSQESGESARLGIIFMQWQCEADAFDLIVVNLSAEPASCQVSLPLAVTSQKRWVCASEFSVSSVHFSSSRLDRNALFIAVLPHHAQVLRFRAA